MDIWRYDDMDMCRYGDLEIRDMRQGIWYQDKGYRGGIKGLRNLGDLKNFRDFRVFRDVDGFKEI